MKLIHHELVAVPQYLSWDVGREFSVKFFSHQLFFNVIRSDLWCLISKLAKPHERALYKLHLIYKNSEVSSVVEKKLWSVLLCQVQQKYLESSFRRAEVTTFETKLVVWAKKSWSTTCRPSYVKIRRGYPCFCVDVAWN